jgi:predicted permease
MMFVNAGNMGLPLMVLAFGEAALPAAVVLFFVENTLHYVLGTWLLDHHARLWNLWRVPVILAALAGAAVSLAGIEVWPPLYMAIKLLGDVSIPLLLFSLGVRLATSTLADLRIGLIGAAACPLMGMALAWPVAQALALAPADASMLLLFGALPPAVLNFVFAERYRQEPAKVASIVLIGNLGALLFVPLALLLVLK